MENRAATRRRAAARCCWNLFCAFSLLRQPGGPVEAEAVVLDGCPRLSVEIRPPPCNLEAFRPLGDESKELLVPFRSFSRLRPAGAVWGSILEKLGPEAAELLGVSSCDGRGRGPPRATTAGLYLDGSRKNSVYVCDLVGT